MESFNELFETVKEYCQNVMTRTSYSVWISVIYPLGFDGNRADLYVRNSYQKGIIEKKYLHTVLQEAFDEVCDGHVDIVIYSEETAPTPELAASRLYGTPAPAPAPMPILKPNGNDDYEYTFDTFIVGSSNKFAHAAAYAVATKEDSQYNPLFIHGPSGLGKTHLLMAIANEIHRSKPDLQILYVQGEQFTNELINAIRNETTPEFHDKYRAADVLLVDDIQFIAGKESTQEEFFHTFNALFQAGKQIVLTSDRPPREIATLEDRLKSRFEWGLMADISAPDLETRIAIIQRKAELCQLELPEDVVNYIAKSIKTNIRQLEGAVKKMKAYQGIGSAPSLTVAQNAIKDILTDNQPVEVTVERILDEVARTFRVTAEDIRSKRRTSAISNARQASVYIIREVTGMSMEAIGEELGGRDHSTIVYANKTVSEQMETDRKLRETIEDIIKNIRS